MNILWDFRLFSSAYRDRGVGVSTLRTARAIMAAHPEHAIFVWGDAGCVPEEVRSWPVRWIAYKGGSWKSDIWRIPLLCLRYRMDIVHYWIALGPLPAIGMSPWRGAHACCVVYDLGVECWHDIPYLRNIARRPWRICQRWIFRRMDTVVCISEATRRDVERTFGKRGSCDVIYPPMPPPPPSSSSDQRMPYFITLGGDRHKNSARIVAAFHAARRRFPEIALFILGETDEASHMTGMDAAGLTFETMERYAYHLQHARGLIFCSTHEGLGLPPIEAMAAGCPVIVSDIPVMHETCQDAACFADPASVESIAAAIGVVHEAAAFWARKAAHGFEAYARKSDDAGTAWLAVYARLEKRRTT